jgi:cytochrome P450
MDAVNVPWAPGAAADAEKVFDDPKEFPPNREELPNTL